jgi:hypothetical protein
MFATFQASGRIKNVREWYLFSVHSASDVLAPPTVALTAPPRHRHIAAAPKLLENPTPMQLIPCPTKPKSNTLFLPNAGESAILPHIIPVNTWARVKTPCRTPASKDISLSGALGLKDFNW